MPNGDPRVGRLIDQRYRLGERLGAGGMGVVYAARHEITGREVAIKFLHASEHHTDQALARFAREARTAAALIHPNVVEVLDAGLLPDRTPFLVMERLRGEPLGQILWRERRLSPVRVAHIVSQAAAALGALHARGVVHRDVKTDNLFVESDGRVKLLDFGLAIFTDRRFGKRVTEDDVFNGTPQFMPPEVFDGEPTPAWDVYGLATIAFELLAGVVPFECANPVVMLCTKRESVAPRLCDRADASFSRDLERVLRRGLERDPPLRHPTPLAFAEQLARAAGVGDALRAADLQRAATSGRLTRRVGPHRRLLLGACCAAVVAGAMWMTLARSTPDPAMEAPAAVATSQRQAEPLPGLETY